ncbi:hypothetical protein C8R46DRAFT_1042874 [Mycena filopes]|nr:hypothetical protein C8R46DRAFT_1042874 [Mycena filopes]
MAVLYYRRNSVRFRFQVVPNTVPPSIQISAVSVNLTDFPRSHSGSHHLSLSVGRDTYYNAKLSDTKTQYRITPTLSRSTFKYNASARIRVQQRFWWMWRTKSAEADLSYEQASRKFAQTSLTTTTVTLKRSPKITAHLCRLQVDGNTKGMENIMHEAEDLVGRRQHLVAQLGESRNLFEKLHPVAKAVFTAVNQLYQDLKEREDNDVVVLELLDDIAASFRHVTNVENFKDRNELHKSIREMERLAEDTVNAVPKYYDGNRNMWREQDAEFKALRKRLDTFNSRFSNDLRMHTAQTLTTLMEKFMKAELNKKNSVVQHQVRRAKPIDGCAPGTRQDVLSGVERWIDLGGAAKRNVFWINGFPGSGKTAIASTLVERLRKSKQLGSSFFFERDNSDFTSPSVLWGQVAYDLAQRYPEFAAGLFEVLERGVIDFNTTPIEDQFKLLVLDQLTTLAALPTPPHFVVVIDALDEFHAWSKMPWPHFKLVVTSRPEAPMSKVLRLITAALELRLSTKAVSEDIRRWLKHEMKRLAEAYDLDGADESLRRWPQTDQLQSITTMAGGLWVWARTLINFLESGHPAEQLELVMQGENMGPQGDINVLYKKILRISFC